MTEYSEQFLSQCAVEGGFRMRGQSMTRIETFVGASFAFAITLLVISLDAVPENIQDLLDISKGIPAFIASAAHVAWI